ncbi:DUF4339 domain-containing protein [Swingsia samuiensis]|uniref:DUF4339 domain-containing protein n=1 Tax=Swingsia samuiensis TaxID=1293412 RepID=A0A4Y6UIK0_9PROT|nr:DUF4339 domain-containing protein [Swingsia samuiensis]QDH16448.1 DUF4339 domain-containing protein [Swingsia samuiensis]
MEWFYENNGQQIGPVSRDEILQLIVQRRIGLETLVWTSSFGDEWKPVAKSGLILPLSGLTRLRSGKIPEYWAWIMLVGPWAIDRLTFYIFQWRHVASEQAQQAASVISFIIFVLYFLALTMDRSLIRQTNKKPPSFWWWIFSPGYFWKRLKILKKGRLIFAVSVVLYGVNTIKVLQEWPQIQQQIRQIHNQNSEGASHSSNEPQSDDHAEL